MSCILPIQVPSIGFSSVGSHQHKMNLVWTLLLLAAATGPAYSQICQSYQAYEDYFRKTCESECQRQVVPLSFSSLFSGLLNILNGLKIVDAKGTNFKIIKQNDGLCLEGGLDLSSRCNEYTDFQIKASFKLNIAFSVQNGRPHYSCSSDFAEFKLSFEGLGIASTLANVALQSIQPVLKKTVYSVFDAVMKTCNDDSSKYSEPFYVGKEDCRYQFNSVKNNGDSFSFAYSVVFGAKEVVNSYHDEYSRLGDNERKVVVFGIPIVSELFGCTRGLQIQYPLSDEDCRSLDLGGYEGGLSLYMRIEEAPQCAISSGGFQVRAGFDVYVKHHDTSIVHARAVANMNAAVTSTNGYQNIGFSVSAGLSFGADIERYSMPKGCICSVKALHYILSANCGQVQAALNARLNNINLPVSSFAGKPGSRRSCSPKTDCIRCAEYNDGY